MKFCARSETQSIRHLVSNRQRAGVVILIALLFALCCPDLQAQVGDNNPTGVSGIFNGQIADGIDPYTGNVTRSITDIYVNGGVSTYPLALVRTANSRTPSTTGVFGWDGGWSHNYYWIMEDSELGYAPNFSPKRYTIDFPDGRVATFRAVNWNPTESYYRVRPGPDTPPQSTSAGVRERLAPLYSDQQCNTCAWLVLPDGGKVKFQATQHTYNGRYYYTYKATAIIDPYGLTTTIDSELVQQGQTRRITKVTEPAGRYLQFYYISTNSPLIDHVTEFINGVAGRSVQYNYMWNYNTLTSVAYYGQWTAHYQYTDSNIGGGLPWLLWTCDDPMYPGPMRRIAYEYKAASPNNPDGSTPVYGQIESENYYDGNSIGPAVSTLTIGEAPNVTWKRKETRGDGKTRTFIYDGAGYINWASDFMGHYAHQTYDAGTKYINAIVDLNQNQTDYTRDSITGKVTQITLPLTPNDTPGQNARPIINYSYTNNYYLHTIQGENGQTTTINRYGDNRVQNILYPDGGSEAFTYDSAHFYQVSTHQMVAGGTETWTYDSLHRKETYRNPDNPTGNPTARYYYDGLDRVNGVLDALSNPTNWTYNDRGQVLVTTLPTDPVDNQRHTITYSYNDSGNNAGDGTLISVTDQLGHITSYTYDDYRRLKSVTPPVREPNGTDNSPHTTYFYYGVNWSDSSSDYKYVDSNVTWVKLPSGKKTKTEYDDNRRKQTVIVGYGTPDPAMTVYGYDNMGNLNSVIMPTSHSIAPVYDERNRPSSVSDGGRVTNFTYDTSGRRKSVTRPNGQVITYDSFDAMNRVTQQTATQSPGPPAVTQYTYYGPGEGQPVGFLKTFKDPHLNGVNDQYTYTYDSMGRKQALQYPLDSYGPHRTEQWSYDTAGRLYQFTNRNGNIQTFSYDALNRMTGFTWNDGGFTPSVSVGYDAASRLTSINNANANISRAYFNDNLLRSETEQILLSGGQSKTVSYTYDADANRSGSTYPAPENYAVSYTYNGRNQLKTVDGWATYYYDWNGKVGLLTSRTLASGPSTTYSYDALDRVQWISNYFNGSSPGFNYGYDDANNTDNRKYTRRLPQDVGEVFKYDLADQAVGVQLNVPTPQNVQSIPQTITYDANGNRTNFHPYGATETYDINNLSQYISRTIGNVTSNAAYDSEGNLTLSPDPTTSQLASTYDAQNRLVTANKNGVTLSLAYDGLNRQVRRTVTGGLSIGGGTTFNVWDGWDLIGEYQAANGGAATASYLYGATGLIGVGTAANGQWNYYFQDGTGSTSHVTDQNGFLQEWYRYDLQGTPFIYDAYNNQLSTSNRSVRHLFTGQQWYTEVGLYDLRNRFYSPDLGRFLQPDPIDFGGDPTNLYRYCGNNPVTLADPLGLWTFQVGFSLNGRGGWVVGNVTVGLAFDGQGNIASFRTYGGGLGAGAQASAGVSFAWSNAGTVNGLAGWYNNVSGGAGLGPHGSAQGFWGDDATNPQKRVYGGGITVGGGIGGGGSGGASYTSINPWSPSSSNGSFPPPGSDDVVWWDVNGVQHVIPNGRITVTGTFLETMNNRYYGYLPTSSTVNFGGGIARPGGWHSPVGGPNFGVYTPTGGPIPNSIFGPNNFYSGLDPVAAVGSTSGEGFRGIYSFP